MKTDFSDIEYMKKVAVFQAQAMAANPPAIKFRRKKEEKKDDDDVPKKKLTIKLEPDNEDSEEMQVYATLFESGSAEEWIRWRIQFDELIRDMPLNSGEKMIKVAKALLKGDARDHFVSILIDLEMNEDDEDDVEDIDKVRFDEAIEQLGLRYFNSRHAYRRQRNYLRYHVFMMDMPLEDFKAELLRQNTYLRYFPIPADRDTVKSLPDDELLEIVDRAKRVEWQRDLLSANIDPYSMSLSQYYEYLEKLETKHEMDKILRKTNKDKGERRSDNEKDQQRTKKKSKHNHPDKKKSGNAQERLEPCKHCGKNHSAPDEKCWKLNSNKGDRPAKKNGSENMFSAVQMAHVMEALKQKDKKSKKSSKKRQMSFRVDSSSDSEDGKSIIHHETCADMDTETNFAIRSISRGVGSKSPKNPKRLTTEVIVELRSPSNDKIYVLRTLLDTGTSRSIVLKSYVSQNSVISNGDTATTWTTMGGKFTTTKVANLCFTLPEFSTSKEILWPVHVDETNNPKNSPYDLILGIDFLTSLGIILDFSKKTIRWGDTELEMKEKGVIQDAYAIDLLYTMSQEPSVLQKAEERQARILDADYSKIEMDEYIETLDHLDSSQKELLLATLKQFSELFGGGLGRLNIDPIHLELKEGARPYHAKAFSIPKAYEATTKKEVSRFENLGIWKRVMESPWTAGTFIQPKKTGDVRVLTDFRKLNEYLVRRPHPLPKISDLLQKLEGFKWATAIDLSMGYYHIPLDKYSQGLCGTVMPWGIYQYTVLPMGICNAPDIFQGIMMKLLGDLVWCQVYMDDILITSNGTYNDHIDKLEQVLRRLEKAGFRANVRKCTFAADHVEYLGYEISRAGIHPQPKKVEAILKMQPPTTKRQLRRFLGMVNYYRDMWRRRSHILAPLTALCSKSVSWKWSEECQEAFEAIKRTIARETLLKFPDFSKEFHVYTDASDYQLGAVIMQDNKPLAFYSRKLSKPQKNYTTGEQELLSIVETLKEFRNILLGQQIVIHTDHLNILYSKLASPRVIRWRLMLEEYGARFVHVKGEDNVVADTLSRHPNTDEDDDKGCDDPIGKQLSYCLAYLTMSDQGDELSYNTNLVTKEDIEEEVFPLSPKVIGRHQKMDKELLRKSKRNKEYSTVDLEGVTLISKHGKVMVPETLQARLVHCYHELLQHPGMTRMEATIRHVFDWRGLREMVEEHCRTCSVCQRTKKQRKKYGHLPPKMAETTPWERVDVDIIGTYKVRTPTGVHKLTAMTMIDPVTGWFEIAPLAENENAGSYEAQKAFDSYWLARYPRPRFVGTDNGVHFKRFFKDLIDNYGLTRKISTEYNPQSNGIIERVHQVLGNALRAFELEERELDESNPWDEFLTAAAYAIRSTHHTTLQASPAQLVYGRDMLLPVTFVADWTRIAARKQNIINKSNKQENRNRIAHTYKRGDRVLLTTPGILPKVSSPRTGPYTVVDVQEDNGTVTIKDGPVHQTVNIRRLAPFWTRK